LFAGVVVDESGLFIEAVEPGLEFVVSPEPLRRVLLATPALGGPSREEEDVEVAEVEGLLLSEVNAEMRERGGFIERAR